MKITIGTASSNMNFEEDLKLIKSSLLYADEIELVGMAEYAVYHYLPRCLSKNNELDEIIKNLIPFLELFDNDDTKELADQLCKLHMSMHPYLSVLKKDKNQSIQELLVQLKYKEFLDNGLRRLFCSNGTGEIQYLIDKNIISVHDFSLNNLDFAELTDGYFASILDVIKQGTSYPVFDYISTEFFRATINDQFLDLGRTDQETIQHAGVSNNVLMSLPAFSSVSIDEIQDLKKELRVAIENYRTSIKSFSKQINSMPWDNNFKYELLKLYDAKVVQNINEINELSSETSVLKNLGSQALVDEKVRRKARSIGEGLHITVTSRTNITNAIGNLEKLIRTETKLGLTETTMNEYLKNADIKNQSSKISVEEKDTMQENIIYYHL